MIFEKVEIVTQVSINRKNLMDKGQFVFVKIHFKIYAHKICRGLFCSVLTGEINFIVL